MENYFVELTQEELRILCTILVQSTYKLGDAKIVLPLFERLDSYIIKTDPNVPKN